MNATTSGLLELYTPHPVPFRAEPRTAADKLPTRNPLGRLGRCRHRAAAAPNSQAKTERVWASELNGQIVGMIGVALSADRVVRIMRFRIDPKWQHTRILTELFRRVHEYCLSQGGLQLVVEPGIMPGWIVSYLEKYRRAAS